MNKKRKASDNGRSDSKKTKNADTAQDWKEPAWMNDSTVVPAQNGLRIFHLALESPINGNQTQTKKKKYTNLELPNGEAHHQVLLEKYLGAVVKKYNPDVIVLGEYYRGGETWELNKATYNVYSAQGAKVSTSSTDSFTSDPTSDMTLLVKKNAPVSRWRLNFRPWRNKSKKTFGKGFKGQFLDQPGPNVTNRKAYRAVITFLLLLKVAQAGKINFEKEFKAKYIEPLQERFSAVEKQAGKFGDFIDITYANRNILFVHLPNEQTANASPDEIENYLNEINGNFFDGEGSFYDLIVGDLNLGGHSDASERTYIAAVFGTKLIFNATTGKFSHIGLIQDPAVFNRIKVDGLENLELPVWKEKGVNYLLGDHEGMVMDVQSTTRQDDKDYSLKKRVRKLLDRNGFSIVRQNNVHLNQLVQADKQSGGPNGTSVTSTATHKGCFAKLITSEIAGLNWSQIENLYIYEVLDALKAKLNEQFSTTDVQTLGYGGPYAEKEINEILEEIGSTPQIFKQLEAEHTEICGKARPGVGAQNQVAAILKELGVIGRAPRASSATRPSQGKRKRANS